MENRYIERSKSIIIRSASCRQKVFNRKSKDGKLISVFVPVNQIPSEDFCVNKFGYPQSDIQKLMTSNSELERESVLRKIKDSVLNVGNNNLSNMSMEEKLLQIKPRWVDTPTEREVFANFVLNSTHQSLDDLFANSSDGQKVAKDAQAPIPSSGVSTSEN